ncbi:MAG: glycolate oxidase subunit GlcF [Methylomonas sp.]|jgi:glycolate oxidase iron-sulfur subunit|uniref:glycolate oxidase subunit GlcF n=1 Tax=Methylomonas sp. TaxID=418 RepID=UPI0025CE5BD1|nr:glycolate oxidase subunit GlcF [Methylomonas sp.]MCK9605270.1 glycolate oxidase subunit GlcF [Methylomonas sp.]
MQTQLADFIKSSPRGQQAEAILRHCVHCGFCNASCPTYQLLGDELDGPRGRIYLIKQVLEGNRATRASQLHLDRCLTCRACETSCPSGVEYGRLLDIGRNLVEQQVPRRWHQRLLRQLMLFCLPFPQRFAGLLVMARLCRPLLPARVKRKLPLLQAAGARPAKRHQRRMLLLEGCVQPALAPRINAAAAKVLDQLGISVVDLPSTGCCGALAYHLNDQQGGLDSMRRLIDAWWPAVENGVEAIVLTASGCGVTVKEYGVLLQHDPSYARKAAHISGLAKDIGEILLAEDLTAFTAAPRRIAFHSPCTLQHGQRLSGEVERLLIKLGFKLTQVADGHLCCGSAGSYALLQPELSGLLQQAKIQALQADQPELIATANIGCWLQLQEKSDLPVVHWIELLVGQ